MLVKSGALLGGWSVHRSHDLGPLWEEVQLERLLQDEWQKRAVPAIHSEFVP